MKKTAVVILNYNGSSYLKKFLPSVIKYSSNQADIIVADNASSDDSVKLLQSDFSDVKLIELNKNYGFAEGYNAALKLLNHDYFVLLNSDVEVTEGWIEPVIKFLNNHKDAAACQPKLLSYSDKTKFEYAGAAGGYLDMFGYPFCRGRLFDKCEKDNGQYDDINEVFWATGACMFVRASDFFAAGGFDSDFFAHMEEIDLCWRLKNTGKKIFFIPDSVVYHVGGGTLQKQNPFKTYLNFRNSLFTLIKNLRKRELYKIPVRLFLDGLAGVRFFLMGEFGNVRAVINSHISFYKYFIKMWKKRKSIKKLSAHTGVYKHSVILAHFFRNKGKFSELKIR